MLKVNTSSRHHRFKFRLLLSSIISLLILSSATAFTAEIKLAWDPNTDTDLAGYKIYYGTSARIGTDPKSCGSCGYSTIVPIGNATTQTISNLVSGQAYYFSVTAYDTSNNESGFSNEVSGMPTGSFSISLKAGWNLISFPTLLQSTLVTDILSSISGLYEKVYTYKGCDTAHPWKIYDPTLPPYANDLQYVDSTTGIWINMKQNTVLNISGSFSPSTTIPLCLGSNLISYTGSQAQPVAQALSSISGKYDKVYMYKADDPSDPWKIYDPSLPAYVNDLTTIEPGFGYWINMKENCNLVVNN